MTSTSRRQFLAVAGSGIAATLAGCLGGGTADLDEFDPDERPAMGDPDAPVRMAVFEDFSCPGCRQFKQQFTPQLVEDYVEPGDVLYFHADFPAPQDQTWSYAVPNGARAVFEEAGNDPFWTFTSDIYAHQGSYSYDIIEETADDAAGVGQAARQAAEDETYSDDIEADVDRGESWGVQVTPTVVVEDEIVDLEYPSIADAIESAR